MNQFASLTACACFTKRIFKNAAREIAFANQSKQKIPKLAIYRICKILFAYVRIMSDRVRKMSEK
jgi:hypothetical protein